MGLTKHYLKYGQTARDKIFGISKNSRNNGTTPLSMLISQGTTFNSSKYLYYYINYYLYSYFCYKVNTNKLIKKFVYTHLRLCKNIWKNLKWLL